MSTTVILDVDGTLIDTNYHHALAWYRALRAHGHIIQMWRVHRHIGMGGDQLVEALIGEKRAAEQGEAIRAAEAEAYGALIGEVEPMEGARELIENLRSAGASIVLASSAKLAEVDQYLDLLDARELVHAWTTAADVQQTKPAPDLVRVALEKAEGGGPALMIGDSAWDVEAANAAGVPTLAVLTGGFSEAELTDAGALKVVSEVDRIRDDPQAIIRLAVQPPRCGRET
jgi:HAD superfamily hydrolase (TIGR01509 family)